MTGPVDIVILCGCLGMVSSTKHPSLHLNTEEEDCSGAGTVVLLVLLSSCSAWPGISCRDKDEREPGDPRGCLLFVVTKFLLDFISGNIFFSLLIAERVSNVTPVTENSEDFSFLAERHSWEISSGLS